jgi:hypothetical protein
MLHFGGRNVSPRRAASAFAGDAAASAAFFATTVAAQQRVAEALVQAREEALAGPEMSDLR